ncbi:serine/threonine-protein kinase ULK3 [Danaus plexippus plexippus]|uniref:non-specific serine/threonine protein kinase n=1 Tax=Danaus plexippus plexippus TaxID=278856 RepID=A0A212EU71_DANPL|nr:serine/threonine-protein kinase ULK3 [Danaus plexippus plexippus]
MSFPKIEGYVVTEKLGSGSYSTVYKAYTKVGARSVVAVKCVDKSRVKHSGAAIDNLITEIRLLKTLRHPHIVHMKEFTWDAKHIYIITEYCCGGDLSKYIHKYGRVPEHQPIIVIVQVVLVIRQIPANSSLSAGCLDLLTRLLQHDPNRRISYEEFFSHQYLDLEYMPSKQNYNTAVGLIKRAIELDGEGRLGDALEGYTTGLRYLVPAARVHTDPARRAALAAKLERYMDRAEEIKRLLSGQSPAPSPPALPEVSPRSPICRGCASGQGSGTSYDFRKYFVWTLSEMTNKYSVLSVRVS